jgi:predicted metal-dependent hydrolase
MRSRSHSLHVQEIPVEVVRKRIKHVYVRVSRETGAVRVSAPARAADAVVRSVVESKLAWIREKRREAAARPPVPSLDFVSGEIHWVWGRPHQLDVIEASGRTGVRVDADDRIVLRAAPGASVAARRDLLDAWYRESMRVRIPELVARWEPAVGRSVAHWGVRKMKTRWGSCNPVTRRISLSLELAKRSPACLEYVVLHEMAHLIEANHGPRFYALMDRLMPAWRGHRDALNAPLDAPTDDGGTTETASTPPLQ